MAQAAAKKKPSAFATRLFTEWRRLALPSADVAIVVAVSGGADSTALLLAISELVATRRLAVRVVVAHLDHGLRGEESRAAALWVGELAARCGFVFESKRADVRARANQTRDNLEQAARRARYEFFDEAAAAHNARLVLLAHTLDDQAETVLLRLMRGSGAEGLSGMRAVRPLVERRAEAEADSTTPDLFVVRPLLGWARRIDTESYCRSREQEFLFDEMNDDVRFARVRVRKELLPLLRTFNPRIEETLTRTAALLRDDAATLEVAASVALQEAVAATVPQRGEQESGYSSVGASRVELPCLDVRLLAAVPPALQRRALRRWLRGMRGHLQRVDEVHIRAVQSLLGGERGGRVVEIPGGSRVERRRGRLYFVE